jgi:predicted GIY-YIG superfamily endonuclease
MKQPAVYKMTSQRNGTLYVGVTSNLPQRVYEHKNNIRQGFTSKYGCKTLVYYEFHESMQYAIGREKALKGNSRKNKLRLIEEMNPNWDDLYQMVYSH